MKLGDFKTPTGASGNIFKVNDLLSLILGAVVLIFTFAMGQNIANKVGTRVPGLDSQVEQPWRNPQVQTTTKQRTIL